MKDPRAEDLEDGISLYHTKKEDPTAFKNSLDFVSSTAPAIKKTMSIRASAVQAKKEGRHQFPVDGKLFGMGTNIWSVYEDPEQKTTWEKYNIQEASLVVSCMFNRNQEPLCDYMKPTKTALIVVSNNNAGAQKLYDRGATFVLQQVTLICKRLQGNRKGGAVKKMLVGKKVKRARARKVGKTRGVRSECSET
jgi:hypothetical protein